MIRLVNPESHFVAVGGLQLHYLDWGNAGAPPLVMLHAYPLNAHAWQAVAPAFAQAFHVIAPDARGHGDSQWSQDENNDGFVEDLHGLIESLGLDRVTLCGNSLGGAVGMLYAGSHPERVERLILLDTGAPAGTSPPPGPPPGGARPPPFPTGPFASEADAAMLVEPTLQAIGSASVAREVVAHNLKPDGNGTLVWKPDMVGLAGGLARAMADPRRFTMWSAVQYPTLIIRGGRSRLMPPGMGEAMVAHKQDATLVEIADAGHFVALEQPDAFVAIAGPWLGL
jgi:pimeloyl-ACP methyl ester carboxylesterase